MVKEIKQLDYTEMGRRIRSRREFLNLSREKLAEKLDVSPQFIADLEYGNKGLSIKNLYFLCQIIDVPTDYILAGKTANAAEDSALINARQNIMQTLRCCDVNQLKSIEKIAQIYLESFNSQPTK